MPFHTARGVEKWSGLLRRTTLIIKCICPLMRMGGAIQSGELLSFGRRSDLTHSGGGPFGDLYHGGLYTCMKFP